MLSRSLVAVPDFQNRLNAFDNLRGNYPPWTENNLGAVYSGYTIVNGASADSTGSWVELDASTEADIYCLEISAIADTTASGVNTSTLLEIGIGASGSEQTIMPYLQIGYIAKTVTFEIPIFIPAGSRLAARHTSATANKSVTIGVRPKGSNGKWKPAPYCLSYGVVLTSSRGTVLTQPGAANTKGAWTELTSATGERLSAIVVCVGSGSNNMVSMNLLLDIGIGPSGSEEVIISDVWSQYSASEEIALTGLPRIFGVDIPAGVRLSARQAKTSVTTNHNCNLIGIPWR